MQSSEEDALSGIGGSIGNGSILSHKSSVDLVTKVTIVLGCCLIVNSLALTVISKNRYTKHETIVEDYLKKQGKQLNPETKVEEKKEEKAEEIVNTEKVVENTENKEKIEEKETIDNEVKVEQNVENKNIEENKNNNVANKKVTGNTNK